MLSQITCVGYFWDRYMEDRDTSRHPWSLGVVDEVNNLYVIFPDLPSIHEITTAMDFQSMDILHSLDPLVHLGRLMIIAGIFPRDQR